MRILGIDVGTHSVKAVELDSAFGRSEVHDYYERLLGPDDHPYEIVRELIQSLPRQPDRFVVAVPTSRTTFRNIELPTRDKRTIQASLVFELEDELPFELDEITYDYSITSQETGVSRIHIATVRNNAVSELLDAWHAADVDPDVITTEGWAFRTLIARSQDSIPQQEPVMIIHMGRTKTLISIHWNGSPIVCREMNWGGTQLTQAIATKYGLSLDQAESSKIDHGFVLTEVQLEQATPEQVEYSDLISDTLDALIREIRQAEFTCKSAIKRAVTRIYLSGGSALLPGLDKKIEEQAKVHTRTLKAFTKINSSGVTYSETTEVAFPLALGLALTASGPERSQAINVRKGPFAKRAKAMTLNLSAVKGPLIATSVIILSFLISLFVQNLVYQQQLSSLEQNLSRSLRTFLGSVSPSAIRTYTSNPTVLRKKVESELQTLREQAQLMGRNPRSPLDVLKTLSGSIPKEVVVDLTEFQIGAAPEKPYSDQQKGRASLTFLFEKQADIARVKSILEDKMSDLIQSEPKQVGVPGKDTKWQVTYTGTPKESAYGN